MKILDKYIIKKFLGTFFFTIVLIISLAIVIDITEKLDDFLEGDITLYQIIFTYYLNFIPYYINLFMFLFVFISVVFFTSKMAMNSEIISILGNGISFNRMMFPYFISAFILALLSYGLTNFVIPPANKERIDFENKYIWGTYYTGERNIHRQISPGVYMYMESFNINTNVGNKFALEYFEGTELKSKLIARRVKWDSTKTKWTAKNYFIREIGKNRDIIKKGKSLDTSLNISPIDFQRRDTDKATMDYFQLNDFIDEITLRGESNVNSYLLEKYQRIAFPFSTFILTLIGVSLSSRKSKGGTGLNIGIGLVFSFTYIFLMRVTEQFTLKGGLPPMLAAWIPNILFLMIGIIFYRLAPK